MSTSIPSPAGTPGAQSTDSPAARIAKLEAALASRDQEVAELKRELELLAPADERERKAEWLTRRLAELEVAPVPRGGRRLSEEERLVVAQEEYERALARHKARGLPSRRVAR
jgi:hypothetical protein